MRTTSIQAYEQVKASGLVTGLRLKVYSALHECGPLTAHEVAQLPDLRTHQLDSVRPRFAELEDLGVIASVGERECTVTHMKALVWDVTDHVPDEAFDKPKARIFWLIKREGVGGECYTKREKAEERFKEMNQQNPGHELIQCKEIITARG